RWACLIHFDTSTNEARSRNAPLAGTKPQQRACKGFVLALVRGELIGGGCHVQHIQSVFGESTHRRLTYWQDDVAVDRASCRMAPQSATAVEGAPIASFAIDRGPIGDTEIFWDAGEERARTKPPGFRIDGIGKNLPAVAVRQIEAAAVRAPRDAVMKFRGVGFGSQTISKGETVK